MPDATLKDFGEVAMKCNMGEFPLLPHPEWGQDAAYLAFVIDRLMEQKKAAEKERDVALMAAAMLYGVHKEVEFDTDEDREAQASMLTVAKAAIPDIEDRARFLKERGEASDAGAD